MQQLLRGAIAVALLLLYAITVGYMVRAVWSHSGGDPLEFSPGIVMVATGVGGLVSAYVVAVLAVTSRGDVPNLLRANAGASRSGGPGTLVSGAFLLVWFGVGVSTFVVGFMLKPDANQTVSDLGSSFFGVALAAGYAYMGLKAPDG